MEKELKMQKKKSSFKLPHLMFLMLILIFFMSLLTYVIPAGRFDVDPETNNIIADSFKLLPEQTPVSFWDALMLLIPGFQASSKIIGLILLSGGAIGIVMSTGALTEMIDYAVYRLKDKGIDVLIPIVFMLLGFLGGFGGGDHLVALTPLGILVARKLKLDPICALALALMAPIVGFSTSPYKVWLPQSMIGIPPFSGFSVRFCIMLGSLIIAAVYTVAYAKRIRKDPMKSFMGNADWLKDCDSPEDLKATKLNVKSVVVTLLFFAMMFGVVLLMAVFKMPMEVIIALQLPVSIICGLIYGFSFDKIGKVFVKGVAGISFVGIVVGFGGSMSLVMSQGNIIHSIVYYASIPLKNLSVGTMAIGLSIVVMFMNVFIPSASSKFAVLIPIVSPMAQNLGVSPQVAVQAFQLGDGFTNTLTPVFGWTAGALDAAKVTFNKWWKFAVPLVAVLTLVGFIIIYFMGKINWIGF